ncbi:MAG: KUP/HAK/KT family potassium transporter [Lactobacillales bacterium]|jgi:KUP system potassium uptake protein|nr:KUP/HAK/KT family potassium transporter [Lactobacillales bacterium]
MEKNSKQKVTRTGFLIAMGIVYGDIGTSPLYVLKSIVEGQGGLAKIDENLIVGSVSLILWTITLLTTIKYVLIALNADNHGEGGIFSLFTLVRRTGKFLIVPAMIGGAALLADGVLTPAVTITTAIEGLSNTPQLSHIFSNSQTPIIITTLAIIATLFFFQRFGTDKVGKLFGPIMFGWFTFLLIGGGIHLTKDLSILRAINPYYAIHVLISPGNKLGIFILGSVFLATTGAEALYSDLGHVGKKNIRISWPYVKISLIMNYFGQAAWLLSVKNDPKHLNINNLNPFFDMLPDKIDLFAVIFATIAAVIASQSLISGSYSLVSEAIKLRLLPKLRILYPGSSIGQMFIPSVNFILWLATSLVVLYFKKSTRMEAAYGLSITITMLMTSILLYFFLINRKIKKGYASIICLFFGFIESIFFLSSLVKFIHGGYVAIGITLIILTIMFIWEKGNKIQAKQAIMLNLHHYKNQLYHLKHDKSYDMYQTNLVYLSSHMKGDKIESTILYSILDKRPKRAEVYWFVHIHVTNEPYTRKYEADMMGTDYMIKLTLHLGFKVSQEINLYIRKIVNELMKKGKLPEQKQEYTITPGKKVGSFRFVLIQEHLSQGSSLSSFSRLIMHGKLAIKKITTSPAKWFGLEFSDFRIEHVPLILGKRRKLNIKEYTLK